MADYRQIHTCIWKDSWFIELPQEYKLLFIYLFSNERANLTGLYDLSLRVIEFEAGLSMDVIQAGLERFERDGKVYYHDGMVWVPTLLRHNARNVTSPKIQTHIHGVINSTRDCWLKAKWIECYNASVPEQYHMDTLSIPKPEGESEHVPAPVPVLVPARGKGRKPTRAKEQHPAVAVYEDEAKVPMRDVAKGDVVGLVGIRSENLARWRKVIHAWLLKGWGEGNIGGMLDFYQRNEIPGEDRKTGPPGGNGRDPPQEPKPPVIVPGINSTPMWELEAANGDPDA